METEVGVVVGGALTVEVDESVHVLELVFEVSVSRCAGLRRSTETVSVRPFNCTVKCLSVRLITR